jgi:hypothetical protein
MGSRVRVPPGSPITSRNYQTIGRSDNLPGNTTGNSQQIARWRGFRPAPLSESPAAGKRTSGLPRGLLANERLTSAHDLDGERRIEGLKLTLTPSVSGEEKMGEMELPLVGNPPITPPQNNAPTSRAESPTASSFVWPRSHVRHCEERASGFRMSGMNPNDLR